MPDNTPPRVPTEIDALASPPGRSAVLLQSLLKFASPELKAAFVAYLGSVDDPPEYQPLSAVLTSLAANSGGSVDFSALAITIGALGVDSAADFAVSPTAPTRSSGDNTTHLATTAFVRAEIAALVNAAPSDLDTLKELADALNADTSAIAALTSAVAAKQTAHANLTAFSGLTLAADKLYYGSGTGTLGTATLTAAGRALLDDADAGTQRATLGLGNAATRSVGAASTDVAAGNRGVPAGGSAGQVLAKSSDADYAMAWVAAGGGLVLGAGTLTGGDAYQSPQPASMEIVFSGDGTDAGYAVFSLYINGVQHDIGFGADVEIWPDGSDPHTPGEIAANFAAYVASAFSSDVTAAWDGVVTVTITTILANASASLMGSVGTSAYAYGAVNSAGSDETPAAGTGEVQLLPALGGKRPLPLRLSAAILAAPNECALVVAYKLAGVYYPIGGRQLGELSPGRGYAELLGGLNDPAVEANWITALTGTDYEGAALVALTSLATPFDTPALDSSGAATDLVTIACAALYV